MPHRNVRNTRTLVVNMCAGHLERPVIYVSSIVTYVLVIDVRRFMDDLITTLLTKINGLLATRALKFNEAHTT